MRCAAALVALFAVACSRAAPESIPDGSDGASDAAPGGTDDGPLPPIDPHLAATAQLCKLLSNRNTSDPTPNDVQHAANVLGADLGIPVVAGDRLFVLFGDTIGVAAIWPPRESHPDSVGYGLDPASAIAADPSLLCSRLAILALDPKDSLGPKSDPSIHADFAGAAMAAPAGHALGEFIRNPAGPPGGPTFANLPGDFEVPSGAFAVGNDVYIFYTTVGGPGDVRMQASYLAKWTSAATSARPAYQILYAVDERFDANGPLHGGFINIAAEVFGEYVYLFGTGDYRRSPIRVARKRLAELDTPGGFEDLGEIVATPGYGELSVRYIPQLQRWMLLAEELLPASNRIVAYLAARPEGPWGQPLVVHDMADPSFRAAYCCTVDDNCAGHQMFNCDQTGFYGTYLLPSVVDTTSAFTVTYTMSSFAPYNVALFQATFTK